MARIVKRSQALSDLEEILVYLGRNSLTAAERFHAAAERAFENLAFMPQLGARYESVQLALSNLRLCPIRGFRKYLILYRPLPDGIEVLRVIHGSRDLEGLFRTGQ